MKASDRVARRILPRAVVAQSRIDARGRLAAASRRRLGRRGRVELYFAFDDPCSAVAVLDLDERLRGRDVDLVMAPVVARGIAGDPAVAHKREYAVIDARRLLARRDIALVRSTPLEPGATAFLARWVAAVPASTAVRRFCVLAAQELWLTGEAPIEPERMEALWRETVGGAPDDGAAGPPAVARNERRLRRHGGYDTPMAWVHGRLYFAHDRLAQIGERLDELGWTAPR